MVIVKTSHNKIWHPEQLAVDIVAEYQQHGHVVIKLNSEGPCADAVGLYSLLDYVCDNMSVNKTAITIETVNFEETHSEYHIVRHPQHWIKQTLAAFNTPVFKRTDQALFGCLYNVPSWDRLCILAHAAQLRSTNTLHCNGTWEPHRYNSYYLDTVTDYCATEMFNIVDYLKTQPVAAVPNTTTKPITARDLMQVTPLYNNFFVDIVAETYTHGKCFFITEKTVRPMLMLTPFVIQGPQGYLSTLKSDYGIQSFDAWWDESYDQYQNYERIQKIYQVMDTLDQLTTAQRETMYNEMQPVLEHNNRIMQGFK